MTNGVDVATASTYAYCDYLTCPHFRPSVERDVQGLEKIGEMSIVPNPAGNLIEVQLARLTVAAGTIEVVITNTLREICLSQIIASSDAATERFSLNLPDVPNGVYILNVKCSGMPAQIQKFMIIR